MMYSSHLGYFLSTLPPPSTPKLPLTSSPGLLLCNTQLSTSVVCQSQSIVQFTSGLFKIRLQDCCMLFTLLEVLVQSL